MAKLKIYLASPLFTKRERQKVLEYAKRYRQDFEVYVPMEHKIENAWGLSQDKWARKVFEEDIKAIQECDEVVCLYYGLYSDSGSAWECGYAYALGKKVHLIDCSKKKKETSLMMVMSADNEEKFYHKTMK